MPALDGSDSEEELIEDIWQDVQDLEGNGSGVAPANDSEQELVCEDKRVEQRHQQTAAMHTQQPSDQQRDLQQQQQQQTNGKVVRQERILLETSNATSLNSNREKGPCQKSTLPGYSGSVRQ